MNFIAYRAGTGEILWQGTCPEDMLDIQADTALGVKVQEGIADLHREYVDIAGNEVVKPRPVMEPVISKSSILADGNDTCVISGLPAGVRVKWPDDVVTEETDGSVEFGVTAPGRYRFIFTLFPYIEREVLIEAHSPN